MVRTTIVIPNYNGISYLKDCLDSILADPYPVQILVVDNGSTDGSAEYLKQDTRGIRIYLLQENTGFCGAVNTGIRLCDTEFVLLLNNDVTVAPGFVKAMEEMMDLHPKAFSANAQMRMMKDPEYMDNAGDYYCALGWAYDYGKGHKVSEKYQKPRRIFAACGGAAIYRCSILEKIGLFDEAHFAYLEDVDIGYRARIYGFPSYYQPKALVYHAGSSVSGSKYNEFKINLSSRNSIYLIRKNMPLLQILLNLPFFILGFGAKTLFFVRKGYGRNYLKGLLQGCRGSVKHVKFEIRNLPAYLEIQWELWVNVLRRICT